MRRALVILLLLASSVSAQAASSSVDENLTEEVKTYSTDAAKLVWPTANDPNAENLIHSILSSWCGHTYSDAVRDSTEKGSQFEKLRAERDQRYAEWMRCQQERTIRDRELEMECERTLQVQSSAFEREKAGARGDCEAEEAHIKGELESCELKLKKKPSPVGGPASLGTGSSCPKEIAVERAACTEPKQDLQAQVVECEAKSTPVNLTRLVELESLAVWAAEERAGWAAEKKRLAAELGECSPARARAQKRLNEVLTDGRVEALQSRLTWRQMSVLHVLLLLVGVAGAALFLLTRERETQEELEGGFGWISVMPAARLRLVDAESAKQMLVDAHEGSQRFDAMPIVLATSADYQREDPPLVFLLIPLHISSSMQLSLFSHGSVFAPHVERAHEIVSKTLPKARLVVVLYEGGGCVFLEATLQSLRLTADKVAYEALPKGSASPFPRSLNLLVLWLDKQEGLRASDSERESDLAVDIKGQPWAQYLLMRSGRWGQVHAQFL